MFDEDWHEGTLVSYDERSMSGTIARDDDGELVFLPSDVVEASGLDLYPNRSLYFTMEYREDIDEWHATEISMHNDSFFV